MSRLNILINKIVSDKVEFIRRLNIYRFQEKKIVFAYGSFELLHRGHVEFLVEAAAKGDILIIGIYSDASIKKQKGNNRPLQDEKGRAITLSGLGFVDHIVVFEENGLNKLIEEIKPAVIALSAKDKKDFTYDDAEIALIDFVNDYSTLGIDKLNKR